MKISPIGRLPFTQDSWLLSIHGLSLSVPLIHSLPYKQKVSRYARHEHDMANVPLQATTKCLARSCYLGIQRIFAGGWSFAI
jgi:hypothetical protein